MIYKIITKNVKSLILRVDKSGIIKVSAPKYHDKNHIDNFVKKNIEWIESRLQKIPRYENGSIVRYFNEEYRIEINYGNKNTIVESSGILALQVRDSSFIKKLISKWYVKKSKPLIDEIVSEYKEIIGRDVKKISLREMSSRWGSCNYKNATITLNSKLFNKPRICFKYVLAHELVHLIHPNHGSGFYGMLEKLLPNWREIKIILNKE